MLKNITILFLSFHLCFNLKAQSPVPKLSQQYHTAIDFADAAVNSIAALNSLIKKENYRNKISSFNNPTSNEMGFNLQVQINAALKPLLEKSKNVNANKFTDVVSSLVGNNKNGLLKSLSPATGIFSTLTSLVGNLTVTEKKITKNDLDSFIINISKYFGQYEKLNLINQQFDISIDKIDIRLQELQTDLKDYLLDLITASNTTLLRSSLKQKPVEELLLKYLDKNTLDSAIDQQEIIYIKLDTKSDIYFPVDAIKTAKDITSIIQKIFAEYQKIYTANYNDIKNILIENKQLGTGINKQTIENSLTELQTLYTDSKNADALTLRFTTLTERLKTLVATEKIK